LNLAGFVFVVIKMARIMIENARAMTPPSFEGMEHRIPPRDNLITTISNRNYSLHNIFRGHYFRLP